MKPKLIKINFRMSRERAVTLHRMLRFDLTESESPEVRKAAAVAERAVLKAIKHAT